MQNPKLINAKDAWNYEVPTYFIDNEGIHDGPKLLLQLCRGNKADESAPRQEGMFTETLLEVCRQYLTTVNTGELGNRDTSIAITHIEDALLRLQKRADDRKMRDVQGTYQK